MQITLDECDRVTDIRGEKLSAMSRGYACFKGLQAGEAHQGPARIVRPLKREADGEFREVRSLDALDEVSAIIGRLVSRHGPDSVALFMGTPGYGDSLFYALHKSFLSALGSQSLFTTMTIDQPAKVVSFERQGGWAAGIPDFEDMDVLMFFGANPLISHTAGSIMSADPTRRMKAAKARGLSLICIDPRRSETAQYANLFLQPLPGQDAAIAAGILRLILVNDWHDDEFCRAHVDPLSLARLRDAVAPFTAEAVERRAALEPGQLLAATEMFARSHRRGVTFAGTGPCMAPFGNLSQHLVDTINIVCGRFRRAGDTYRPNPQEPYVAARAEVIPPRRSWSQYPASRIRGVGQLLGEKLTGTLADEILQPGSGKVRALIVVAGNPASCVPDRAKMLRALQDLDLLLVVDPHMTSTAALAHYVIPPTLQYERPDLPYNIMGFNTYPDCWSRYTPAVLPTPPASDLVDSWYVLWHIAQRLDLPLELRGVPIDMTAKPAPEQLFEIMLNGTVASLDGLKAAPSGSLFSNPDWRVQPGDKSRSGLFDVMPGDVAGELESYWHKPAPLSGDVNGHRVTHLLSSRRRRDFYNSIGQHLGKVKERNRHNPVFLNPVDLQLLGIVPGDEVWIKSGTGMIQAVAKADADVRRGVASMSHGPNDLSEESDDPFLADLNSVNMLISDTEDQDELQAQPRMSAIPVAIFAVPGLSRETT